MPLHPSARFLTLGVCVLLLSACGGGSDDEPADTAAPSITSTAATVTTRSLSAGLTHTISVVATDNVAVSGGTVVVTKGGTAIAGSPFTLQVTGGNLSIAVGPLAPPLIGSDVYQYQATVRDAAGNVVSTTGSFSIQGPTPPSTSGVPL